MNITKKKNSCYIRKARTTRGFTKEIKKKKNQRNQKKKT